MTKDDGSGLFKAYVILVALTFFAFWPCLSAGFLNWDDPSVYLENPLIFDAHGRGFWQVFLQTDSNNFTYVPLTMLSFIAEQKLFGTSPLVSHVINLLLHVVCSWLLLTLALRVGLSRVAALLAALVFALHPLRVESVAWVAERKDVLFGVFYVGALIAYWDYLKGGRQGKYLIAFLCGVLSVLAKPMALSLPLVLFLLDERAGRRWTLSALWDKTPFVLALWPIAGITFLLNSHPLTLSWPDSLGVLVWSATFYVEKFFWPADLLVFYPAPGTGQFIEAAILLALICLVTWALRRDGWWRFALLFYVLTMFFIWRLNLEDGARGLVHDRFMYIPSLGFTLCLGAWFDRWRSDARLKLRTRWVWAGGAVLIALLAAGTFNRCFVWQNSWTYWEEVLERAPNNYFARMNRAAYLVEGDAQKILGWSQEIRLRIARQDLERAVLIAPKDPAVWHDLGVVLTKLGDGAGAEEALNRAVYLAPQWASIYNDRGNYYFRNKDWRKALWNYNRAIELRPSYPEVMRNRSLLFRWMRENLAHPAGAAG